MKKENYLKILPFVNEKLAGKNNIERDILSIPQKKKDKIKMIFGHDIYSGIDKLFPNREPRYITLLRNPIEVKLSSYNFGITFLNKKEDISSEGYKNWEKILIKDNKIITFKEFFNHKLTQNHISPFLTFGFLKGIVHNGMISKRVIRDLNDEDIEEIKKALDKFYFIGIVENPKDFLFLYSLLGINQSLPKQNVSKKYVKMNKINREFVRSRLKYDQEIYQHALKLNKKFKRENPNFNKIVKNMKYKRILMIPFSFNKQTIYNYSARLREISKYYGKVVDLTKETLKKFKIEI
jgi:hypothetical protein